MRISTVNGWFGSDGIGGILPASVGLLILFAPTYYKLFTVSWASESTAYGYIIVAISAWLFWSKGRSLVSLADEGAPLYGGIWLAIGLLLNLFGSTQEVFAVEVFSQIPVVVGVLLCLWGRKALRLLWFPVVYLAFLIPVPAIVLDMVTAPLKQMVSFSTAQLLYWFDYPIARSGVVLQIGGYRLLVADACSGLNSLFSLYALGMVYLYLAKRDILHNLLLFLAILPIACIANIVRVVLLVLITYHYGHDAGQGFLHGSASIALLVSALLMFLLLDEFLLRLSRLIDVRVPL